MSGTIQQERRWEYLRKTGRPSRLAADSAETVRARSKIRSFQARGMSFEAMAAQIDVTRDALSRQRRLDDAGMNRTTYEEVRKLRFVDDGNLSARVPLLGTQRRARALRADGFTYTWLSVELDHLKNSPWLQRILTGQKEPGQPVHFLIAKTARDIEALYEKLLGVDPLDVGISQYGKTYSVKRSAQLGYAPSKCWDGDTIDDPEAIPEWTGMCGTPNGALIHEREDIPMCEPCRVVAPTDRKFDGQKLKALRLKHGLSQRKLEAQLGLTKGHCHHWENGRYAPRKQVLARLLSALDATFEDVME
jgi:DNA-binding XRE family transcriptional regulator